MRSSVWVRLAGDPLQGYTVGLSGDPMHNASLG